MIHTPPRICPGLPLFMYALSRTAAEQLDPIEEPHIFISVRSPGDPNTARMPGNEHTLGEVHLSFHDLDTESMSDMEEIHILGTGTTIRRKLYSDDQAGAIVSLVRATVDVAKHIVIHCDAGLSRSPGIGAALTKVLGGNDAWWFNNYHPNRLVYRRTLEAAVRLGMYKP